MTNKQWKDKFLSSGLPLEFETAKVLAESGFAIDPEYIYERFDADAGQTKDFSVDLHGTLYFPTSNPNNISASLELLVECKYRAPNKTWVFLPDVNMPDFAHDSVFGTLGYTIRAIDEFSFSQIPEDPIYDFEQNTHWCYKGLEINLSTGDVHGAELRRGVTQLQYGLPRLISEEIHSNVLCHADAVIPFFVLPILVTTAELRVLKKDTTLEKVKNTDNLEDITQKVPYLILFNSFGPDFVAHSKIQFRQLSNIGDCENVKSIEERLRASGLRCYEHLLPSSVGKALAAGTTHELLRFCSQFMVCSFDELPNMLAAIKQVIRSCLRKRRSF